MVDACPKCGGAMEAGVTSATGLLGTLASPDDPRLMFVTLGTPTSANPLKAFKQGTAGEQANQGFLIRGKRCAACGFLELFATDPIVV
jgi:hypothetical protein